MNFRQELDPQDFAHIFYFWDRLTPSQRTHLLSQVQQIDKKLLEQQKAFFLKHPIAHERCFEPFVDFSLAGHQADANLGKELIRQGQLGCLLLAGGQGTRLAFDGPKGCFPVSVIKNKSLFQLCAEKVLAAGKQAGRALELAIMTSPLNDKATRQFFVQNQFFGLDPDHVSFFTQGMLPLLDAQGHLFLEAIDCIARGPNGNGLCLREFVQAGIWERWQERGIHYLNVVLIDNPLADPFDAELLGFHVRNGNEVSSKSTLKQTADEKVGVFVKESGRVRVIEYSELPEKEKNAKDEKGRLKYCCANLGLFCFSMDFILRIAEKKDSPLHRAWKAVSFVDEEGISHKATQPNAWKFETFIFDVLQHAHQFAVLLAPREECFAPLKNKSGENSLAHVQEALQQRDRQILRQITGIDPPHEPFELSADFYYPTSDLLTHWKGKIIKGGYIT